MHFRASDKLAKSQGPVDNVINGLETRLRNEPRTRAGIKDWLAGKSG